MKPNETYEDLDGYDQILLACPLPAGLKETINNLLWATLPDHVTMKEAESIALEMYDLIMATWNR